jgi:Skp family chaperone for outer membrane proteins
VLGDQITDEESKLEVAKPEDKPLIEEKIALLKFRFTAQVRASEEILERYRGQAIGQLYLKITDAAAELAIQSGYTLVLTSDEDMQAPTKNADQVIQAASLRRILYADDRHDITQELIDFMNTRYVAAASGG